MLFTVSLMHLTVVAIPLISWLPLLVGMPILVCKRSMSPVALLITTSHLCLGGSESDWDKVANARGGNCYTLAY